MAISGVSAGAAALMAGGGLFLWSGFHGASVTGSLRDLISGRQPPSSDLNPLTAAGGSAAGGPAAAGDTGAHGASAAANQAIGRMLAAPYGWATGQQWADLVSLWNRESGWSAVAQNPASTAYGIAQFLDTTWATVGYTKTSDPATQIAAGLKYIKGRYGSPSAAWAHETSAGWY